MSWRAWAACTLGALAWASSVVAEPVPAVLAFSAQLARDDGGTPPTSVELQLSLFDAAADGERVWQEAPVEVDVDQDGVLTHELGRQPQAPLQPGWFTDRNLFIEVEVDGEVMRPRVPLLSVAYALRAEYAVEARTLDGLSAEQLALREHAHDERYLRRGATIACPEGQHAVGLDAEGSRAELICEPGRALGDAFALDQDGRLLLAAGGVHAQHIAAGAVGSDALADAAIETHHLANGSVTGAKLAANSVDQQQLAPGSVVPSVLGANTVDVSHLKADGVTVYELAFGCSGGNSGVLTTQSGCQTLPCGSKQAGLYWSCNSAGPDPWDACTEYTPSQCANQPLTARLVAP